MIKKANVSKRLLARFSKSDLTQLDKSQDPTQNTLQAATNFLENFKSDNNGIRKHIDESKWSVDSSNSVSHSEDEILTPTSAGSPGVISVNRSSSSSVYDMRRYLEDETSIEKAKIVKNKHVKYATDFRLGSMQSYSSSLDVTQHLISSTQALQLATLDQERQGSNISTLKITKSTALFEDFDEFNQNPDRYLLNAISSVDSTIFSDKKQPKARHPLDPPPALEEQPLIPTEEEVELFKHFSKIDGKQIDMALVSHGTLLFEHRKAHWRSLKSGKIVKHPSLIVPSVEEIYDITIQSSTNDVQTNDEEVDMEKRRYQLPEYMEHLDCRDCKGLATLSCYSCSGQPTLTCFWCSGTGKKDMRESGHSICKKCEGKGFFACRSCNDSGKQECPKCDKGEIVCGLFIDITPRKVQLPVQYHATDEEERVITEMQKVGDTVCRGLRDASFVRLKGLHCEIEETQVMKIHVSIPKHLRKSSTIENKLPSNQKWKRVAYVVPASMHIVAQRSFLEHESF